MTTGVAQREAPAAAPQAQVRLGWRVLISVLAVAHLTAVFIPPFRFASRSSQGEASPLADSLYDAFQPYINAAYLDHGYFYFAPNPGPSHLVRYEVDMGEGEEPLVGTFPELHLDRPRLIGTQQPRLLYHRHFMLAESLHAAFTPPEPPDDLPASATLQREVLEGWKRRRQMYEMMKRSFEEHLSAMHGGKPVRIVRLEHRQPTPAEFLEGLKIDDERLYRELPETPADLLRPGGPR